MGLSIEDLMKRRVKVIAPYPEMRFKVGDILIENEGAKVNPFYQVGRFGFANSPSIYYPEKYPAIFHELQWWEHREIAELPEYVKLVIGNTGIIGFVHKVELWHGSNHKGVRLYEYYNKVKHLSTFSVTELLPATLSDYKTYINQQKDKP